MIFLLEDTAVVSTNILFVETHIILIIVAEVIFLIISAFFKLFTKKHLLSQILFPFAILATIFLWNYSIPLALSIPAIALISIIIYNKWGSIYHYFNIFRFINTWSKLSDSEQKALILELNSSGFISIWKSLRKEERDAFIRQYEVAKIKGFWTLPELDEQILKHFVPSKKVKIKVTRGYNLLVDDGKKSKRDIFYHCIHEAGRYQEREIELLLHRPCIKSEHTKKRAKANGMTPENYVETLFEVIKEVKTVTEAQDNKNEITVKFYQDYEIKWRYYVFQEKQNNKKILFLNYYDDKRSGADSPMLKIEFGEGSLCQDFDAKFDEIFQDPENSIEIVSNIKGDNTLINSKICSHPECEKLIKEKYCKVFKTTLPEVDVPIKPQSKKKRS